jgi:nitroreductase
MRSFQDVVQARRSVRAFLPDRPVALALLHQALALAQQSPSNCNAQPWSIHLLSGAPCARLRERLVTAAAQPGRDATPAFQGVHRKRQVACAIELYTQLGVARGDHAGRARALVRNFEFFDAPHLALLYVPSGLGVQVALDAGCWLQTFLLSLENLGVQSCAQASLRSYPDVIAEELGISGEVELLCGVAFGYQDPAAPVNRVRQPRAPLEQNVTLVGFEEPAPPVRVS